jgi:hypothetical protein
MTGFNQPPWDVYEFKYTAEKACREFRKIVSVVLDSGGALVSLEWQDEPAGFSVLTSLHLFVRELAKVDNCQKLPPHYKHPGPYLEKLSLKLGISLDHFDTVGYIADIAVDESYRGRGYSRILLRSSLDCLQITGSRSVMAWTVNPAMSKILSQEGFFLIDGIGTQGEGIDFTVYNRQLYPVLDMPPAKKAASYGHEVIALHYLKKI